MKYTVKIGSEKSIAKHFAFDHCHKIYLCEDKQDIKKAKKYGYEIYDIYLLDWAWDMSCSLRFISNMKLNKDFIPQSENKSINLLRDI